MSNDEKIFHFSFDVVAKDRDNAFDRAIELLKTKPDDAIEGVLIIPT